MSQLLAPHSLGRLPLKIGSGFAGFTADHERVSYESLSRRIRVFRLRNGNEKGKTNVRF